MVPKSRWRCSPVRVSAPPTASSSEVRGRRAPRSHQRLRSQGAHHPDGGMRRGNWCPQDHRGQSAAQCPSIEKVLVFRHLGQEKAPIQMMAGGDVDWAEALAAAAKAARPRSRWTRSTRSSSFTPPDRPESPRASSHHRRVLNGGHVTTKYVFDLRPTTSIGARPTSAG